MVFFSSERSAFTLKTRQHINKLIESVCTKNLGSFISLKFQCLPQAEILDFIAEKAVTPSLIGWKEGPS